MVTQQLSSLPYRPVTVYIPNEVEGQILGGTRAHASAAGQGRHTLETYARRRGLDWLVRQEAQILYPRAAYTRPRDRLGSLYPDIVVALNVHIPDTDPYQLEAVGIPPVLAIEIISKKTGKKDRTSKVQAYADMGIQEYVTFDPRPRKKLELIGHRLFGIGQYVPIRPAPEGGLWLVSIGLRVIGESPSNPDRGPLLRFFTAGGERLLHIHEEAAARLAAEQEAERERQAYLEERQARLEEHQARLEAEAQRESMAERLARAEALLAAHGLSTDHDP